MDLSVNIQNTTTTYWTNNLAGAVREFGRKSITEHAESPALSNYIESTQYRIARYSGAYSPPERSNYVELFFVVNPEEAIEQTVELPWLGTPWRTCDAALMQSIFANKTFASRQNNGYYFKILLVRSEHGFILPKDCNQKPLSTLIMVHGDVMIWRRFRITDPVWGNPPVTDGFPSQSTSNTGQCW